MKKKIFLSNSIENSGDIILSNIENSLKVFNIKIKEHLETDRGVSLMNSGTSAIHLSLILSGVKERDEVICQTSTFAATAFPILYQKAIPIFVDSEKDTWNMCPDLLEETIKNRISKGKKPKAIIFVNLYGMPAKIDEILAISKKYDIILIEDAAESFGSSYKGKKCGTFGDYGILSFNNNKIITTYGGGALICKKQEDNEKAIFFATQAKDIAPHYQHSELGYNYKMSNLNASFGISQIINIKKQIQARRNINNFYNELFKDVDGITVLTEPSKDFSSNHWLSCVLIDKRKTGFSNEDLRLQLLEDNIESRPLWKPMHLQPIFKDYKYFGHSVSEELFNKGLCLPSGSNLTKLDFQRISASINKLL